MTAPARPFVTAPARPPVTAPAQVGVDGVELGPATVLYRDAPAAVAHVLRRLTYGPRAVDRAEVARTGLAAWVERQLDPARIDDRACDALLAAYPRFDTAISTVRLSHPEGDWNLMFQLGAATVARRVWSERQLYEQMVELWSDHLHVTSPSADVWDNRAHYDTVIRRHAMGTFRELLLATTTHPAMLAYLGADESRKASPNENLGRELLELHTVGVGAGYTEADVRASALLLTGLGRGRDGEAQYQPEHHHVGPLTVMGFQHPNASAAGGMDAVRAYLSWLAVHPATARSVCRRLAVRLVSDAPSERLVDALAAVYLAGGSAIVPVLRALFADPEFTASAGAKVRRPFEDVSGVLRAFGVGPGAVGAAVTGGVAGGMAGGVAGVADLYWILQSMGHPPMAWHPPDGYPDVAAAWASAAGSLSRWNVRTALLARWWPTALATPTLESLLGDPLPTTWGGLVDTLAQSLLGEPLVAVERAAVLSFVPAAGTDPLHGPPAWWNLTAMATLVMSTSTHTTR